MKLTTNALIWKALQEQNYNIFTSIPQHLWNEIEIKYVEFIKEYFQKYSQMPSPDWFTEHNPAFRKDERNEPLKLVFDQVSEHLIQRFLEQQINDKFDAGGNVYDPAFLQEISLKAKIMPLEMIEYNTFDRTQYFNNIKRFPFHIPWFDETLGGLIGGDLGFIFGRMKSGKTSVLQMIVNVLHKRSDCRILVFSNEIPPARYAGKLDAFEGAFNPKVFRTGEFTSEIRESILNVAQTVSHRKSNIIVAGRAISAEQVTATYLNMMDRPDIIIIDGVELMGKFSGDAYERSNSLGANAYGLKQLAVDYEVPILGTLQANRSAAKSNEAGADTVAGSDIYARACDYLIGVSTFLHNNETYHKLHTAANRDGEISNIYVRFFWDTMTIKFYDMLPITNTDFEDNDDDGVIADIENFLEQKNVSISEA